MVISVNIIDLYTSILTNVDLYILLNYYQCMLSDDTKKSK